MTNKYDAIVIGAGHNGLVCATYLAQSGRKVLVVEANADVGGAVITREFAPDHKVSAGAHLFNMMQPKVIQDLGLKLDYAARNLNTVSLDASGDHITFSDNVAEGGGLSNTDAEAYSTFKKRMRDFSGLLAPLMLKKPPRTANADFADIKTGIKLGLNLRFGLGKEKMSDFMRIIGINIFDVLNEVIDNDLLKGAISLDAVLGTHMGPRSPNSVLSYLYRITGELDASAGSLALPNGGLGSVTSALKEAAEKAGVEIRTSSPVANIVVDESKAVGVTLEGGETINASLIVSNADPKKTFLDLVGGRNLEAYFTYRVNNIRMKGNAAKFHLALDGLPSFKGLDEKQLGNRLIIAPSMPYVERAFDHAKYGEMSDHPAFEITIPSAHDTSLAPSGKHVLSAIVQYAPYGLKEGWNDETKSTFINRAIEHLEIYAPGISGQITHRELLTPVDMEKEFNMGGGHWHHGEFAIDQLLMMRPVYGTAQYKTPLDGLYLCGAGSHPGGGVTGAPGHNAAKAILAQEK